MTNTIINTKIPTSSWKYAGFFTTAIILGILNGLYQTEIGTNAAQILSDIFIRLFKFVSVPIIGVSICCTIATLGQSVAEKSLWKRTLFYTLTTTVISATVAAIFYLIVSPANIITTQTEVPVGLEGTKSYINYLVNIIPNNPLSPFVNGEVLTVLLVSIVVGIAIRQLRVPAQKETLITFVSGIQSILFFIVKWIIRLLPLGIFGFITLCVKEFQQNIEIEGITSYFTVVIGSNLIQGLIILPLFLILRGINPLRTVRNMSKALLIAFFSKSSAGTLPVTISCAENKNGINPKISRFVLPICTTINMNGCAAFILITVIYLMQNNGMEISIFTMALWVLIATIAAIGNAGVPMGCYFLSASLLSSMNVPIHLLGIILPVYAVIDMIETTLNVWSDSVVTTLVNKDLQGKIKIVSQDGEECSVPSEIPVISEKAEN